MDFDAVSGHVFVSLRLNTSDFKDVFLNIKWFFLPIYPYQKYYLFTYHFS